MIKEKLLDEKLLKVLESNGINRRDFLKYCAATAALFGLSEFEFTTKVAHAIESTSKKAPVMWLEGLACAGCTISLTQSLYPPASEIILDKISLRMHDTAMLLGLLGWDRYDRPVEIVTPYFASSGTGRLSFFLTSSCKPGMASSG
jgi:hypothetical protein